MKFNQIRPKLESEDPAKRTSPEQLRSLTARSELA